MAWGWNDLPDLSGKIIIVTGASSGIGLYATQHFAAKGATVILAVRNVEKGEKVVTEIKERIKDAKNVGKLVVMECDLSKQESIRTFASKFQREFKQLDVLINNAGVMMIPEYTESGDGYEMHYATNYLGPFLLTSLLLDMLIHTEGSRIVNVSSIAHKRSQDVDYDIMSGKKKDKYDAMVIYSQTKLANMLFTFELSRRLKQHNKNVLVLAAHPGWSTTGLQVHAHKTWWFGLLQGAMRPFFVQGAESGAMPLAMAATDSDAKDCNYYGPDGPWEMKGRPKVVRPTDAAKDPEKGKKLWNFTENLLSVKYHF